MDITIQPGGVLKDGRYEIKEFLGTGQEKKIYLASDRHLDCLVALDVFSGNNPVMPGGQTLNAWEPGFSAIEVITRTSRQCSIAGTKVKRLMTTRYLSGGSLKDLITDSRK